MVITLSFNLSKEVSSEQMCYNIHMGDLLTSGKLHIGHNDLDQPMVDPTKANNNIIHPITA